MKKHATDIGLEISHPLLKLFNYAMALIGVAIIMLPLFIILNVSLKTSEEYGLKGFMALPDNLFNFDNYIMAIKQGKMLSAFVNSSVQVAVGVTGSVFLGSMASYVLNRFDFRFKKIIITAFVASVLIPHVLTSVSTFMVIKSLGLFNTREAGFLLYTGADVVGIYIFLQFLEKIPKHMDESAKIDGASYFRIYWSVILPQMMPGIATVIILKTISIYNDFLNPYLFMPKTSLRTVTVALNSFSSENATDWPVMSAAIVTVLIPTLLLYLFLQRFIISGVSDGSMKG
ncbi:carbohydrate ABC transporter permease [Paenibacillus qinlingensis]|uniref:Multiple sugar transport system permease protein n=1 Tax=Paenibacillus qinlingensis TaxID=1837343 RepID=A0ABU1NXN3_9BACL|nr:carbohydrate ABC transporter permease [Paenibacillus qinlingensis]MDR6552251.1 multiple sugar transport system permease protein [Paenibacillus qinlingensis]